MPSTIGETDTFQATLQRPNNGELADAASLQQFMDPAAKRMRYLYNRSRSSVYDITRAPYGAVPGLGVDCTAAMAAALSAANVAGGGLVTGPVGEYRFDSGFTVPRNVTLAMPPGTGFFLNHATADFVTFDNGSSIEDHAVVSGVSFNALVPNTGRVIYFPNGPYSQRVTVDECTFNHNGGNDYLRGQLFELSGAGDVELIGNRILIAASNAQTTFFQTNTSGFLRLLDNTITMSASFTGAAVLRSGGGQGIASRNRFLRLSSAGSSPSVLLTSSGVPWLFEDNIFSGAAGAAGYAYSYTSGARIRASGNDYLDNVRVADPASGSLASGSQLDLLPNLQLLQGSVATIDLRPEAGFRSYTIKCAATSGPAIILPRGWFDGQEIDFSYSCGVNSVAISFATTPVTGTTVPTINPGNTLTGRFVWEQRDAAGGVADRWIQKGTWGVGLTLV